MNHDILVAHQDWTGIGPNGQGGLREAEHGMPGSFRRVASNESTLTVTRPLNEADALMRCAPGDTPEETVEQLQELRDSIITAQEALTPEEQFILNAIHSERLSVQQLADRLGLKSKGHMQRLIKAAEASLRNQLTMDPLIRERLHMEPDITPADWGTAAALVVAGFTPIGEPIHPKMALTLINNKTQTLRDMVNQGHVADKVLGPPIVTIGVAAANLLAADGLWNADEIVDLLCRKQHDYGHSNIMSFGMVGVAVRDSDKVARYNNLSARKTAGQAEPLIDAVLDMVGYGVIAQMLLDGTFLLELAEDLGVAA